MTATIAILAVVGGFTALVLGKVALSMVSKEIEGRLGNIGYVLLRLARRRLPSDLREMLHDEEWLPEMDDIQLRYKDQPITRLAWSLRYSAPLLLWGASRTGRVIQPTPPVGPLIRILVAYRLRGLAMRLDKVHATEIERDSFGEDLEAAFAPREKPLRVSDMVRAAVSLFR